MPRPIYEIATEIAHNWENPNFGAAPYLEAMLSLESVSDKYIHEDGRSIVLYFLANCAAWRGETAKRIKKELRDMVKR